MKSNYAKVLDNGRRALTDFKRNRAPNSPVYFSEASRGSLSGYSTLGKRKKPNVCKTKPKRSSPQYYTNFTKSGLPKRLMFYKNGGWKDHVSEIIALVRKEFELKRSFIEVKLNSYHLVFDFVRMVQFNFRTAVELPMAWIDESGGCFFPEVYGDDELYDSFQNAEQCEGSSPLSKHGMPMKLQIEIEVNGVCDTKAAEYCGETSPPVKRIKVGQNIVDEDSCDKVSDVRLNEDIGGNHVLQNKLDDTYLNLDAQTVKKMFIDGTGMADSTSVVDISTKSGSMWQGRLELFMKQAEITKNLRDNANVRYAWLASTKEASASIMSYGLGYVGLQHIKSACGIGLHLAAEGCVDTRANNYDVDENGVRYMVLCRVVLGNMEMVHAGSKQFHPSCENFDSGVDDLQNPRQYVVWSMNINSHIYPEFVVSFKVTGNCEGSNTENEIQKTANVHGRNFRPFKEGSVIDLENDHHQSIVEISDGNKDKTTSSDSTTDINTEKTTRLVSATDSNKEKISLDSTTDENKEKTCSLDPTTDENRAKTSSLTVKVPQSPWMPFSILLPAISKQVPLSDMKVVLSSYGQFRNKVINRENFMKNLRQIVGDTILKSTIIKFNNKVTLKNGTVMVPKPEAAE